MNKNNLYVSLLTDRKTLRPWILEKHYARRMPPVKFAYGLYNKIGTSPLSKIFSFSELQGIVTFGHPSGVAAAKALCGAKLAKHVLELSRLCINSNAPENAASFFVSKAMKMLPENAIVVSYADPAQGHFGYIYQASNFIYTGITDTHGTCSKIELGENVFQTSKNFYEKHGTQKRSEILKLFPHAIFHTNNRKHRYVYFTKRGHKKHLRYSIKPYPKGESLRYDCKDVIDNKI
jgi:hypothetical protein